MEEDLYEIVPVDPLHKLKTKGSELEKEIDAIKEILRDTITASKINKSSDQLVDRLIEMIKVNQQMVDAVSKSNQELGRQLNRSIREMIEGNRVLAEKLDGVMEFFARASESDTEKAPDISGQLQDFMNKIESHLDDIQSAHKKLEEKTNILEKKVATRPLSHSMGKPVSLVPAPPKPFKMGEG